MKSIKSSPIIGQKLPRNLFLFKTKNYYYYEYVDNVWGKNIVLRVLYNLVYKPHPSKIVVVMYNKSFGSGLGIKLVIFDIARDYVNL